MPHPSGIVSGSVPDFVEVRMLPQLRFITAPLPCALEPGIAYRAYIRKQPIGIALSAVGSFPFLELKCTFGLWFRCWALSLPLDFCRFKADIISTSIPPKISYVCTHAKWLLICREEWQFEKESKWFLYFNCNNKHYPSPWECFLWGVVSPWFEFFRFGIRFIWCLFLLL